MKRTVFVMLAVLLSTAFGIGIAKAGELRSGALCEDMRKVAPEHKAKSVPVAPGAKSFRYETKVDLSDEVPPVKHRGGQQCVCDWAAVYYHRSQLEYRERLWGLDSAAHQFSPAFSYNQLNGGADWGGYIQDVFDFVCDQGCASMADCPYNANDPLTWPSESAYSHAIPFRCQSWAWIPTSDTHPLNDIKQVLANGSTVVLAFWRWDNYEHVDSFSNIYCVAERYGSRYGWVACVVGYDDTLTTNDGPGAFRLVDCSGTAWGDSGFCWMSYKAVMDTSMSQGYTFFFYDTVGYVPELLGRVRIEHNARDRVAVAFSVGPLANPLWYKQFRVFQRTVTNDYPFPDNNLVFDLTEAAPYIAGHQTDSAYFLAWDQRTLDSVTGTIRYFSGQYIPWGNRYASEDTPVDIPDTGVSVHAGVQFSAHDHDVTPALVLGPPRVVEPESSVTPSIAVYNFGLLPASFAVQLSIGNDYHDTVQVTDLAPAESVNLSFEPWTAPPMGNYVLRCSTALAGDEYAVNDTITKLLRVRLHDVALVEILAPRDTVDTGSLQPKVRVRNNGTQTETFRARFRIPDLGYSKLAQATVLAETTVDVSFVTLRCTIPGYHAMSCTLELDGDQVDSNDFIAGQFLVGIAEGEPTTPRHFNLQTVNRRVLMMPGASDSKAEASSWLLDAMGRKVMALKPGANDVRALAPGVYLVQERSQAAGLGAQAIRKVVIAR